MNKRAVFFLALAALLIPLAAHAAVVGGDGSAGLQAFADWLVGPIGRPVLILGGAALGIVFAVGRRDWEHLVNYAIGGALLGGSPTIASFFVG